MSATRSKFTKRSIDALKRGQSLWDDDIKGFGIRCQARRKVFVLKYRYQGRQRWITIGPYGAPWTIDTARHEAQRLWGDIRSGIDVADMRSCDREQPLMSELCTRFIEDYAKEHKKASSVATDQSNIDNHVLPLLGNFRVKDVTRQDIEAFKQAVRDGKTKKTARQQYKTHKGGNVVRGGKGMANRCLALLSKMFNLAEAWGWRAEYSNPVRLVPKYPETHRQRFLSLDEIDKLCAFLDGAEVDGSEDIYVIAALRLLLLTGARSGEILGLKWDQVQLDRELLLLPDSKTGERAVYLNDLAIDLLRDLPKQPGNPYVIVGRNPGSCLINLRKPWHRIRTAIGLDDVRVHDLRHSFASTAAANGASLLMIGKLLGHTNTQTTARYAHLVADPIKDAAQDVGRAMAGAFAKKGR